MPAADDIRSLAERANRDLDAVHDFFEHSKVVWLFFPESVNAGYKLTFTNPATGTTADQDAMLRLAPHYTSQYLAFFTFRQFVSIFEAFLFDLLRLVLLHNPWQLGRKELRLADVLAARDRDEIILGAINKELNERKYEKLQDWFEYLNKAVSLGCPSAEEIDTLAEVKATRDIIEHNAGLVNETYVRKAGNKARYAPGARVEITDSYHLDSWRLIRKVVTEVSAAAAGKLAAPGP
jgi:hypothetical protein